MESDLISCLSFSTLYRDGATIFVNRGWVLRDAQHNTAMPFDRPNWASVTGVVQKPERVSSRHAALCVATLYCIFVWPHSNTLHTYTTNNRPYSVVWYVMLHCYPRPICFPPRTLRALESCCGWTGKIFCWLLSRILGNVHNTMMGVRRSPMPINLLRSSLNPLLSKK